MASTRTRQAIAKIHRDTRRFSASHPFWEEAIELRQEFYSFQMLSERAAMLGYPELDVDALRRGLAYAPKTAQLPARAAAYFRDRFRALTEDFDAAETLKYLIMDAEAEVRDIDERLLEDELSDAQETKHRARRDDLVIRMHQWALQIVEFQLKIGELQVDRQLAATQTTATPSAQEWLDRIVPEFKRLTAPPDPSDLIELYGAENVSFPDSTTIYESIDLNRAEDD